MARLGAFLLLTALLFITNSPASMAEPPNGITNGTVWETHDIWVSDTLQDNKWPVRDALAIWNANGVIKFHYTTTPCEKITELCVPVVQAWEKPKNNALAYATLVSQGGVFQSAKVTVIVDRGKGLNLCTLLHEFGHVIADIPHDWWIEGGLADSFMNAGCDRMLEEGKLIKLSSSDRWYVEEVYRRAAARKDEEQFEQKTQVRQLEQEAAEQLHSNFKNNLLRASMLTILIGSSVALGAAGTLLVQEENRRRRCR